MKELLIVGAGGFGREVLQWCKDINEISPRWNIVGFLDDDPDALHDVECDIAVVGSISGWNPTENQEFVMAIANPAIKRKVTASLEAKGAVFTSVIHPAAHIGSFNHIGKGLVMYPDARITVNADVGDFVTILDHSSLGHDSRVGSFSTLCGNCSVNGHVTLGEGVFFGTHVSTVPSTTIGNDAFVCAGSVVMSDVEPGSKVFGIPARKTIR